MLFTVATMNGRDGLLFSEDVSIEQVVEFLRAPAQKFITLPAFVCSAGGGELFASPEAPSLPQADQPTAEYSVWKVTVDTLEAYNPYQRFNRCQLLIKVMGCGHCEHNNKDCHEKGGAFPEITQRHNAEAMDPEAVLKAGRAKGGLALAEVTYVPPAWTRTKAFEHQVRPAHSHDFSLITENIKKLQDRAAEGVVTKRGHKKDCSRCLFGVKSKSGNPYPGCNSSVRFCHGPFDSDEAQQKNLLEKWDPLVEKFLATNEFTRGQFWTIARAAGMDAKSGRLNVALSGWTHDSRKGFQVKAVRARTYICDYPFRNENYGEVREIFNELPRITGEIAAPSPTVRAIWYLSLEATSIHCSQGWGNGYRDIIWRKVCGDKVEIKTTAPRYFAWGVRELHTLYQAFLFFRKDPNIRLPRDRT